MRVALKYGDLPHAAYVLGRISGTASLDGLDLEHILPLAPSDDWSGDGARRWKDLSDDEQNSHRALAQSLGNMTLLEQPLAERVFGASFPDKRAAYAASDLAITRAIAGRDAWGTAQIAARTAELTDVLLSIWRRPETVLIDDDGLTPVLDAKRRRGWPRGWEREFEYVEYRGEHWEVHDVKYLFNRIFRRLWADSRADVVAYSARRGGPIFPAQAWNGQWDELDAEHFLYMGWDSRYMLAAVQGVLDEAGIAGEVFIKYSYIGAAM
ncbi:HNH endonuclease family protein [Microbacterium elymi]|uniref:HNH endonuclease family protein n=1 Tax=Microbacterium elymi TaxID=2909587 RepID=A0ABY5NJK1_9MICO|nr:HNH endonuclease family protein [Microbacterium elymi]UUT35347.1 HNH endonuclease family protein [Microbacterium elymi]